MWDLYLLVQETQSSLHHWHLTFSLINLSINLFFIILLAVLSTSIFDVFVVVFLCFCGFFLVGVVCFLFLS